VAINPAAFGPSQSAQDAKTALGAAKTATGVAGMAGYNVPYANTAFGLANLALNPTPESAFKFASGSVGDLAQMAASSGMFGAVDTGAQAASQAAAAGMGLGSLGPALASGAMSLFAGGGILRPFLGDHGDDAAAIRRRAYRDRDAAGVQGDVLRAVSEGAKGNMRAALDRDVGGARVGDALASVLNYNLSGGWTPGGDTDLHWRPNPGLRGLQRLLHDAGYRGTTADESGIQWREPMRGDVGGVGEMVISGGRSFVNNDPTWAARYEGTPRWDDVSGPDYTSTHLANLHGSPGAAGWDRNLRGLSALFGMPVTTPDVFALDDAPVNVNPVGDAAIAAQHPIMGPSPEYAQYLSALDETMPEAAARVREGDRRRADLRDVQQWVAGGGGTG
jgi:hypothetical protein